MHIATHQHGGVAVVSVVGAAEIELSNADAFRAGLLEAVGDASAAVLDTSGIGFFDSAGMGALLSVHRRMEERGGKLALAGLARPVLEVFRMVGFDMVFRIHGDVATAVADLRGGA